MLKLIDTTPGRCEWKPVVPNFKTLFTYLSSRVHLGAHSSKKAVQGMNRVEQILDQIMREGEVGAKQAKGCESFGN